MCVCVYVTACDKMQELPTNNWFRVICSAYVTRRRNNRQNCVIIRVDARFSVKLIKCRSLTNSTTYKSTCMHSVPCSLSARASASVRRVNLLCNFRENLRPCLIVRAVLLSGLLESISKKNEPSIDVDVYCYASTQTVLYILQYTHVFVYFKTRRQSKYFDIIF